jgi:hypothetical protein
MSITNIEIDVTDEERRAGMGHDLTVSVYAGTLTYTY